MPAMPNREEVFKRVSRKEAATGTADVNRGKIFGNTGKSIS
jgi:hypothetical protein